ncbi:MAG TPA: glutathione transferase GstA [Terriglobales bacterium]|nr:glutathione transferase GstA [Terriglobales bacterium]
MKLYYAPGVCSMAAHIIAEELGLKLELEKVDLKTKRLQSGGDFNSINGKSYVPALALDNGEILTENVAILQYLAAQADGTTSTGTRLVPPAGSPAFFRQMEWLGFINSELHKTFTPLWHAEYPAEMRAIALSILEKRLAFLERHLASHRYLMGTDFSLVDAYCFTVANWSSYLKIDLAAYPSLQRYLADIAARPAVRRAMGAEGLLQAA